MFDYGQEARRLLSRERADALAQDYRRAQPFSGEGAQLPERSMSPATRTLALLGQLRRSRAGHVPA
jgi:hypothetical protein